MLQKKKTPQLPKHHARSAALPSHLMKQATHKLNARLGEKPAPRLQEEGAPMKYVGGSVPLGMSALSAWCRKKPRLGHMEGEEC